MIKILIADDHPIVRRGLKQILAEEPDFQSFGEAEDSQQALELALQGDWDIVLLDISMPGRGGLDVLKDLRQMRPRLPVLVISMHPEEQFAMRVLKAGASGYLTKNSAPEELVNAIRKILKGGRYVSAAMGERLLIDFEKDGARLPHETLSDREFQVLRMIASGKTPTQIAKELSLSVKTISTYRTRILEKMGMQNNAELTTYAIQNDLGK